MSNEKMTAQHSPGTLYQTLTPFAIGVRGTLGTFRTVAECRGVDRDANAARLALCWNCLEGFDDATVSRLAAHLSAFNQDELNDLLDDEAGPRDDTRGRTVDGNA